MANASQRSELPLSLEEVGGFDFGTVKQLAKPGSWRRGYGYFRVNQVEAIELTDSGVVAKVKGNYQDSYETSLIFTPREIHAQCSCPLDEEWCKHAVAVALIAGDMHLWERFWNIPMIDESCLLDLQESAEAFGGRYRVLLDDKKKPKSLSFQFLDRRTGQPVKNLEKLLHGVVKSANNGQDFTEAEKRELNLMKSVLQFSANPSLAKQSTDPWFHLPYAHAGSIMPLLTQVEEVCDPEQHLRIVFEQAPLRLIMSVNVSMAGNVLISLHWVHEVDSNTLPLEEITLFGRDIPWGKRKNHIYPLSNTLKNLPHHLTKSSFTDIRDADGGKFMYEELPRLRKVVEIDEADILEQLRLQHRPPKRIVTLEMVDEVNLRIRASLDFSYDGVEVPFSKAAPDTPYVMVIKKESETIYWVRRDSKLEKQAYQQLVDGKLQPIQTNYLFAEGDDAIDVYNILLPRLNEESQDEWSTITKGDFSPLKASEFPLRIWASIDFTESLDAFIMSISCRVGVIQIDLDDVQRHLVQGRKYFFLEGAGFVEVPLAAIFQFSKTLQVFDAEKLPETEFGMDAYKIHTFKAGLLLELVEQGVELELSPKFQKFWGLISSSSGLEEIPVPSNIQAELRPYQKQGFNWLWFLYSYGLNGILADDMGLGKTLQTLVLIQQAKNEDGPRPALIVCPSSIVFNWENEARRFTPDLNVIKLVGPDRHRLYKQMMKSDLVITSYAILRRDIAALKNYEFRFVILDESQNIKNWESQTAQASKDLTSNHRLALSGTPIENRLMELWSVFEFLMPTFLYDVDEFKYRYVVPIEEKGNQDAERRLKKQVFPFILRRLKRDVAKELPPKIESLAYCELTEKQQELYLKILEETREQVFSQVAKSTSGAAQMSIFAALLRLRQICCHPALLGNELSGGLAESGKFEALQEMLEDIIENGHRILLFSQFVEMLKIIRKWLEKQGIRYEYLTGETDIENRQLAVERFNRDDSIPIFLISLKAGGTGLNLTGADFVIHYDPWWNPAAEDQATDRAHRIGQTKTVFVYRLIAKGTVEEKIMKLKERKRDLVDSIISADASIGKKFSLEDLKEILTPDF